jgi:hypothetical protein
VNRNLKQQFEKELNCTLPDKEEAVFWTALNPASTKEQVQRASERLYDLLRNRDVKSRDD